MSDCSFKMGRSVVPLVATLEICWREPNKGLSLEDDKQASRRADVDLPNIGNSEVRTPQILQSLQDNELK